MRSLFIIPLVLMSLVSFPSWGLTMDDLVQREGLWYKKFTDVPFTGEIDEGLYKGSFKSGKKDGSWVWYHKNGQLFSKGDFHGGKEEGTWVTYYDTGQLRSRSDQKNGKYEGQWVSYHENGQLQSERNYKNGKLDGTQVQYYDNGQLLSKGSYKNGKREGSWEHFRLDGTVTTSLTGTYRNGVKVSD